MISAMSSNNVVPKSKIAVRSKPYLLLLTFILLFAPLLSSASNYQVLESALDADLTQGSVLSINQSERGFLWLATLSGVAKYDGHKLNEYHSWTDLTGTTHSLNVTKIIVGENDKILLATYGSGLLQYDEASDRFRSFVINYPPKKIPRSNNISDAIADRDGNIWLGYEEGGVTRIDSENIVTKQFKTSNGYRVSDLTMDDNGRIFAVNVAGQIYSKSESTRWTTVLDVASVCAISRLVVEEIQTSAGEEFLIGTRGSGLLRVNTKSKSCVNITLTENRPESTVHEIRFISSTSEYWIGTDQGLYILNKYGDVKHFHADNSGLMNNEVTSMLYTGSKINWIGTYNGLNVIVDSEFELYSSQSDSEIHSIVAIASSPELGVWIATYHGLFNIDENSKKHIPFNTKFPDTQVSTNRIMSLLVEHDQIWIGSRTHGLTRFVPLTGETQNYSNATEPSLSNNGVSAILKLEDDGVLIGTYGGGLNLLSPDGDIREFLADGSDAALLSNNVIMLFKDSRDVIWVGTEEGLQSFNYNNGTLLGMEAWPSKEFSNALIWCMAEADDGRLWFGSLHNGLFYLEPDDSSKSEIKLISHKFSASKPDTIYAMQIAPPNDLWLATNSGLVQISDYKTLTKFRFRHGLQGQEFEFGASHRDHLGRLYFGGSNGYNRFYPKNITSHINPPPVVLTSLIIAGDNPDLTQSNADIRAIELNYTDYFVTFEFSALDYLDPSNNIYRYKLLGFDPAWIDIGNRNNATYTNLPAGEYNFRVQGANAAGAWNHDGISIHIKVNPPPWFSWWAYCIYVFLGLFAIWHGKRIYDNYVIRERALALAREMQEAADRAMDDVQEQLDQQYILVESIHEFNLQKLVLVRECFERHTDFLSSDVIEAYMGDFGQRIEALTCLEEALYYKHEYLLANLRAYTESLSSSLLSEKYPGGSGIAPEKLTIINLVTPELLPAKFALPLSVLIYELFSNSFNHAFEETAHSCFIKIELVRIEGDAQLDNRFQLSVSDNGVGIPDNLSIEKPVSEGFETIVNTVFTMDGDIVISRKNGTSITVVVPAPDDGLF